MTWSISATAVFSELLDGTFVFADDCLYLSLAGALYMLPENENLSVYNGELTTTMPGSIYSSN